MPPANLLLLLIAVPSLGDPVPEVEDPLTLFANGRVRFEDILDAPAGPDRLRGRLRFRAGGEYKLDEGLRAGARISSISDGPDANNPHWDFGDNEEGFAGGDLVMDRLYLEWQPAETLELIAGKFADPFRRPPILGEFVWDADLSPAGLGAIWRPEGGAFDLRIAEAVVQENSAEDDPHSFGIQANVRTEVSDDVEFDAGSMYRHWGSVGKGVFQNQGNTSLDTDFRIWNTYAEVRHTGGVLGRQQGYLQYIENVEDDTGQGQGVTAGISIGDTAAGGVELLFAYFDLEANSLFSPVAQDLTPVPGTGLGTGMTGFLAGFRRALTEELTLRVLYLTSDVGLDDDPYRFVIDFDFQMM